MTQNIHNINPNVWSKMTESQKMFATTVLSGVAYNRRAMTKQLLEAQFGFLG